MSVRSEARAAEAIYRDAPAKFRIGERVRSQGFIGRVDFIAFSNAMESPIYTVSFGPRLTLRLLERDLERAP